MSQTPQRTLSIKASIRLFFLVFLITISVSQFFTWNYFNNLEKYQIILDKASRNKDLIEQIVIYSGQIVGGRQTVKPLLIEDIARFKQNLILLKNGGNVKWEGEDVTLPACHPKAQPSLDELEKMWYNYVTKAEIIASNDTFLDTLNAQGQRPINPRIQQAYNSLEVLRESLASLSDQLIAKNFEVLEEKKNYANSFLVLLWISNILLIISGFFIVQRLLITPLNQISRVAARVGEGDLSQKVSYQQKNEVGFVSTAINGMIDKIRNATEFIRSIEEGNLNVSYSGLSETQQGRDTLAGALINMREKMKVVAEEEDERKWASDGVALFGQILQTYNQDTDTLSYQIISNLVRYVNANQGGLFISDALDNESEKSNHLELAACYAYNRRRYLDKQVAVGEGLVGQAFKDGDTVYITDIPDNYVDITSGLGGEKPRSVLVVPLKLNERVLAVLELASFHEIKKYQIDFLEKLGENIAANLYAAKANERTQRLLEESSRITIQMREQEQKMRENLQTLERTKMEMEKNQEALAAQSEAIQSTLITVELSIDGRILSANDLFLKATGYSEQDIIGKQHRSLIPNSDTSQRRYEKMWAELKAGIAQSGEFKRLNKDGSETWLRATYSPIRDQQGKVYKVLKLAFDITEDKKMRLDFQEQIEAFRRTGAVLQLDTEGNIIDVNDIFLDLTLYQREDIIGLPHSVLLGDDEENKKHFEPVWHKLRQGHHHIGELMGYKKNGEKIWFQGSFNPILDLNGRPVKIIEFLFNITQRKEAANRVILAKEEIQKKETALLALINNTSDAIYTVNPSYRLTLLNNSTYKFFEKLGAQVSLGSKVLDALPKNYFYIWKGYYDKAFAGEQFAIEQAIEGIDGQNKMYLNVSFNPVTDEAGRVSGVAVFSRDVTQRRQREIDIAEFAQKQAKRTNRIIDAQKKTISEAKIQYESQIHGLNEEIQKIRLRNQLLEQDRPFQEQDRSLLMAVSKNLDIIWYNAFAKSIYREWHLYLQTDYHLPDTFTNDSLERFSQICQKAIAGEKQVLLLGFPNYYQNKVRYFTVNIELVSSSTRAADFLMINAQEISDYLPELRRKLRQKRQQVIRQQRKISQIAVKTVKNEKKQVEQDMDIQQENLQIEQEWRRISNLSRDLLLCLSPDFVLKGYNQKTQQFFRKWHIYLQPGYEIIDLVYPDKYVEEWQEIFAQVSKGKTHKIFIAVPNHYEHQLYYLSLEFVPIFGEQASVQEIILYLKDYSNLGKNAFREARKALGN